MKKYIVTFYQSGRFTTSEQFTTKKSAIVAINDFIKDIQFHCTAKRGFKKVGNVVRDNQQIIEHPAFGFEAGCYLKLTKEIL